MLLFDVGYAEKFRQMRAIGQVVTKCFNELQNIIVPGITTRDIGDYVQEFVKQHEVNNSQIGHQGFPGHCCTSVNEELCHGVPSERVLHDGDIVAVDLTFNKNRYHGDACRTYIVGQTSDDNRRLVEIAREAKQIGIRAAIPGNFIGDIGKAIYNFVDPLGYCIASDFLGHGICHEIHESPAISHVIPEERDPFARMQIVPGMTFTVEPIIMSGKKNYRIKHDRWTVISSDGLPSAQFESTLGITETGNEEFCS